jgi:hypothetical protein
MIIQRLGTSVLLSPDKILEKLEASASSGRASAIGEITGYTTGDIIGRGACRLLL